jgi:hypothetical protein
MEAAIVAEWRWIPCLAMLLGAAFLSVRAVVDWRTIARAGHRNLRHMVAFRKAMLAIGLAGIGAGWWLGNPVLFWAGAVIGLEETIETSIALVGLRMEAAEQHRA